MRKLRSGSALAGSLLFAWLLPCTGANAAAAAREVRDDAGDTVKVGNGPCRIVSLAPGTTAMLYAAGAAHCLIGTIAHSTEPAEAAKLLVIGDAETLDFEQLLALRPTVVVVAVDVVQRVRIDRIRSLGIPVFQVHVTRLAGMPESIRRLGALAGTTPAANRAADALDAQLAALRRKYQGRASVRVLYQIWDQPIYTIGGRHVINDALQLCGATNVFADLATAAPAVTREAALARDPELVLASGPPESGNAWLEEWRRFPTVAAVRNGKLVSFTDERIDRMGPTVIAATAKLCEVIDSARPAARKPPPDAH
ncbi:MAG TPA: helical backbone metal receptor [Steroidobacteraceae bacterium]|nr:helical backbone metal receptor [Steroidobacteraceae bacterium]